MQFCKNIQGTLDQLNFEQRKQIVDLIIDHVIVEQDQLEIRYVIPTSPKGEKSSFCHLRVDYY